MGNIYGFCGSSTILEMGYMGADEFVKEKYLNPVELLDFTAEAATALADVHSIKEEGVHALIHGDTRPWNFLVSRNPNDKKYHVKIHDFDQAKMLKWNKQAKKPCGFYMYWCNRNRSPEECKRGEVLNEKIDVYGLGNFIYFLLTKKLPFQGYNSTQIEQKLLNGIIPPYPKHMVRFRQENDTNKKEIFKRAIAEMQKFMKLCFTFNPSKRPNAKEISGQLTLASDKMKKIWQDMK